MCLEIPNIFCYFFQIQFIFSFFCKKLSGMTIRFILVEPKVPENVGASARAINTMGFNNLAYK